MYKFNYVIRHEIKTTIKFQFICKILQDNIINQSTN